jgi:hypothetical protein
MIEIKKDAVLGTFTITGLDPDQLAYIVGLVGNSSAQVDAKGEVGGKPMMPTAGLLYPALSRAGRYGLDAGVDAVDHAQWLWMRRQARTERRERVA